MAASSEMVKAGEASKGFAFFGVGVENANMDILSKICVRAPVKMAGIKFKDMFAWLSSSLSNVSSSQPGATVQIALPRVGPRCEMERPSWRVATACDIGTSHSGSGTPCQDSAAHGIIRTKEGPVLVAMVCDGAGSAAHSEIGSWLASTIFVELVEVHFESGGRLVDIGATRWLAGLPKRLSD